MATRIILTIVVRVLSFPFFALSCLVEMFDLWNLGPDINLCLEKIDSSADAIPSMFISALVAAEDHRNALHLGVDPISMLRAAFVKVTRRQIEGASTIEQQFVRTASGLYECSIKRKVREQLLAIAVLRRRSKSQIASAYLSIAFFGTGCIGIDGLRSNCGHDLNMTRPALLLAMIAQLKYPAPLNASEGWRHKIQRRVIYIDGRIAELENRGKTTGFPILRLAAAPDIPINGVASDPETSS